MAIVNAIDPDAKVTLQNIADGLEIAHLEATADRKRPELRIRYLERDGRVPIHLRDHFIERLARENQIAFVPRQLAGQLRGANLVSVDRSPVTKRCGLPRFERSMRVHERYISRIGSVGGYGAVLARTDINPAFRHRYSDVGPLQRDGKGSAIALTTVF